MAQPYAHPQDAAQQQPVQGLSDRDQQKATQTARAAQETAQSLKGTAVNRASGTGQAAMENAMSAQNKASEATRAATEKNVQKTEHSGSFLQQAGEKVNDTMQSAMESMKHPFGESGHKEHEKE